MALLTELDAVNLIRGSVGKAPVNTLSTTNPDVISAQLRLKNSCNELQISSWWFNTELGLTLAPNASGEIIIPSNAIEVRPVDPFAYLTTRGSRLYDPNNNTFKIDESVKVDMLVALTFDELPYPAANYVQYDAARKFQADFDGDPNRIRDLRADTQAAWLKLKQAESRNRRPNVLLTAGSLRMHRRVGSYGTGRNPLFPGG